MVFDANNKNRQEIPADLFVKLADCQNKSGVLVAVSSSKTFWPVVGV